jgi:DNA-binding SARP family transcriptional activator/tetratricopeptide (TPR) repeat protein
VAADAHVEVDVLGVTEARVGGQRVDLGTPKQRALLAALALGQGRPVSVGALEELLWGEEPPSAVAASLQAYVSGLRKTLEPDRAPRTPAQLVVTATPGYALRLPVERVDATRLVTGVTTVQNRYVGLSAAAAGETFDGALVVGADSELLASDKHEIESLLQAWRGEPYADLGDAPDAVAERVRLGDLRTAAQMLLASIRLALGEHAAVAADLAALRRDHPLHEGLVVRQVVAEYRCGRQADALGTLQAIRSELADELGVDPGPTLQALELAVLRQDPALEWTPPVTPSAAARPVGPTAEPTTGPTAGPTVMPPPPELSTGDPRAWPVLGRDPELLLLDQALDAVAAGDSRLVQVVGEPGIGKTRLAEEATRLARSRGFTVLIGRCSEDEGAPPLWPWRGVLRDLAESVPLEQWNAWTEPESALLSDLLPVELRGQSVDPQRREPAASVFEEQKFQVWDAVAGVLRAASASSPIVVVLDDLHWADASTLRLLRHMIQNDPGITGMLVVTRRPDPDPQGALAEALDAMARRHAVRIDLQGLPAEAVGDLVRAAAGADASAEVASTIRERTEGNPFFVIELARWQSGRRSDAEEVPAAVSDVVERRVRQLPESTQRAIRTAAVIGRSFDLAVLSEILDEDEDDVLDALDPSLAAGVVVETPDRLGTFRFAHALVQEALYSSLPPSRRARRHADAARALASHPAEAAHHWLASGPAHAAQAWRSAVRAADEALRVFGYEEAAELLRSALDAQRDDPLATTTDRYDLLMKRADACRWSADVRTMDSCLLEAIEAGRELGDYERAARAAVGSTEGSLWATREYGVIEPQTIKALEEVLERLPRGDGELRCRAMLSLASELFYTGEAHRLDALVDEGLAMARRIGDPPLLLWALQTGFVAKWRSRLAPERLELASEAVALAVDLGDLTAEASARALHAATIQELGDVQGMRAEIARVRDLAGRRRLPYPQLVVDWMEVPWLAMAGEFERAERLFDEALRISEATTVRQRPEVVFGALLSIRYWQGRTEELLAMIDDLDPSRMPIMSLIRVFLLTHQGRLDEARAEAALVDRPLSDIVTDDWLTITALYQLSRIAVAFEDRDSCATWYDRLAPFAGRVVSAGSAVAICSVDAILGLLAATIAERDIATSHAARAEQQYQEWGVPLAAAELQRWRDEYGF